MSAEMARPRRRAAVLTVSDRVALGSAEDGSGPLLAGRLEALGWTVEASEVTPDDAGSIAAALRRFADELGVALVVTTGGTGLAPGDVTPDATLAVADREVAGIAEALRAASLPKTPHAMLSRAVAALRGRTLIVNLPGSPRGAGESFDVLAPVLDHAVALASGEKVPKSAHRPPAPPVS